MGNTDGTITLEKEELTMIDVWELKFSLWEIISQ